LAKTRAVLIETRFWDSATWKFLAIAIIIIATALAYSNTFSVPFILDDVTNIITKPAVHQLTPLWDVVGKDQLVRPMLYLTVAINWVISGYKFDEPAMKHESYWSFHLLNLAVHIVAALALYGIVRRTLLTHRLKDRFGEHSSVLALIVALLWSLHPMQTGAVTYIIQRAESMMGMFYLLTLYCFIRAVRGPNDCNYSWGALAFLASSLGMLSKQVMVTVLIMVVLYDWIFLEGWKRANIRSRIPLYLMVLASYFFLGVTLWATFADTSGSAGASLSFTVMQYALTQLGVVIYYLRMTFLPYPLCLDYFWPMASYWYEYVPYGIMIAVLVGLTIWALWKRPVLAYLGLWYFVILAPTSTVLKIKDMCFEHRMYLSLAAPLCLVVLGAYQWIFREGSAPKKKVLIYGLSVFALVLAGLFMPLPMLPLREQFVRRGAYFLATLAAAGAFVIIWHAGRTYAQKLRPAVVAAAAAAIIAFGAISFIRNTTYSSEITIWQSVVDARPENPRAHSNLGVSILNAHAGTNEGIYHLMKAIEVDPTFTDAYYNMGVMQKRLGHSAAATEYYRKAVEIDPKYVPARANLASELGNAGQTAAAIAHYEETLRLQPDNGLALVNLALLYMSSSQKQPEKAQPLLETAQRLSPDEPGVYDLLAKCMEAQGKMDEARKYRATCQQLAERQRTKRR